MLRLLHRALALSALMCILAGCGAGAQATSATGAPEAPAAPPQPSFGADGRPFVQRHCLACHGPTGEDGHGPAAGLSLARNDDEAAILGDFRTWDLVAEYVRDGSMPPETRDRPPEAERAAFLGWLDAALARADRSAPPDPGRVTMRRLNRAQYRNTVRDLLGVDYEGIRDFPADDVGYGFDNVGDVLTLPPLLLERYLAAAEEIAARAAPVDDPNHPASRRFLGADLPTTARGGTTPAGGRMCSTNGAVTATVRVPRTGRYLLRVAAWGQQAGPEPTRMDLVAEGRRIRRVDVLAHGGEAATYEAEVHLDEGLRHVAAAFVNDYYAPKDPDPTQRDRNLAIESLELVGPLDVAPGPPPATLLRLLAPGEGAADETERRVAVLRALCDRAFRRPATGGEIERLDALWVAVQTEESAPFERGLQVALQAVLVSPHFLFQVEPHPHPDDPAWVRDVGDFALASRLSYFLWSSMPDDALLAVAREGHLQEQLADQAARMVDDARADAFVRDFGSQWLETRRLDTATPDPARFPEYDAALRVSMQRETETFLRAVLRENRDAREIVSADWTFVDARLAALYGVPDVAGDDMIRITWSDDRRGGVLGHASVLTATSYPTRTSPVKRGKWLLQQIVGAPTPPPPPGVGDLPETGEDGKTLSLRERMARHRTDPTCAVCHVRMDPLGFALENFDAIGRWRDADEAGPIDPSGELPDGRALAGPGDLRTALLADDAFIRTLTAKILTYALGRGPLPSDDDVVDSVVEAARPGGYRLRDLVLGVARSTPFRRHRGEEAGE